MSEHGCSDKTVHSSESAYTLGGSDTLQQD
jgi:hypothetical protein